MTASGNQEQSDGAADGLPPGDGAPGYGGPREDEVSLLDILLVLARHKALIVRSVADNHWEEGENESLRLYSPAV